MILIKEENMREIKPGMQLWWNQKFAVVDFFKRKYGEPVECFRIESIHNFNTCNFKIYSPHRLIAIRVSSGNVEKWFSESYFKTSPD